MDLTDYFEPFDFERIKSNYESLGKYALGIQVEKKSNFIDKKALQKSDVVIIGAPFYEGKYNKNNRISADKLRTNLYQLACFNKKIDIIDLGNLKPATSKKGNYLALRDVIEYLKTLNVAVIILGGSHDLTLGIAETYKDDRYFWLSVIDSSLNIKTGNEQFSSSTFLSKIFKELPNLFHFSLIGYQNHLVGEKLINSIPGINEHLRLGQLRDDLSQAELFLRNSNVLSFDMEALKYSEAPGISHNHPNGLKGEEACQLAYYAGLSSNLKIFSIFNTDSEYEITSKLSAEIIWYFIDGLSMNQIPNKKIIYKVEVDGIDFPIIFKNEPQTGRWWFDVKSIQGEIIEIACSENEYRKAADNEIPKRWLNFVKEMDNLSK